MSDSMNWNAGNPFSNRIPLSLPFSVDSESTFVDAYFRYYHSTYPFLHESLFRAQLQGKSPRPEGNSWPILLNAVLALGAWCIGDDESVMDEFFYRKVAGLSAENSVFESGNLALVQALILLSNYAQKRNQPNTGWNYLGLAVRMALSLGLHKEFPNWNITLLQREMRRRVWWGLFIFDSGASITFGRPVLLPEIGIMDASQVLNIHEQVVLFHNEVLPPSTLADICAVSHTSNGIIARRDSSTDNLHITNISIRLPLHYKHSPPSAPLQPLPVTPGAPSSESEY
jgi:transcriptional regulatory protein GAL4